MTEPLSALPTGTRYYFGREARLKRQIEETAMTVFDGWSYEEIATPTVDYYSLFERGMGTSAAQRAFKFTDNDGRLLALRPDVTSGIARAAATLFAGHDRPLRFCYAGPIFRQHAQSQAEWRRESTQAGCELIGTNSLNADLEMLAIAVEVLLRLGLDTDSVVTLNNVEFFNGAAESLSLDANARDEMRRLIDSRNVADLETFLTSYASGEDRQVFARLIQLSGKQEILDKATHVIGNGRSRAALHHLAQIWRVLDELGLTDRFEIDLGDVARLDYYTGLTFKIYVNGAGRSVGSGGRYDNLTATFGRPEAAIGFVLDVDGLAEVLKTRNQDVAHQPDTSASDRIVARLRNAIRTNVN